MPGKRKSDQDTWLVCQSKKMRSCPIDQSVFDSTLARLRSASRRFFQHNTTDENSMDSHIINPEQINQNNVIQSPRQIVNNIDALLLPQDEIKICSDCQVIRRRVGLEKCSFCETRACHLNRCKNCDDQFCSTCSIQRYEDSATETFTCFHCLS